jgi:two-component system CheB/CheR fusion protein
VSSLLDHLGSPRHLTVVVVMHLDPTHEGGLAGVLARHTELPVHAVADRARLEPGQVLVIPPDRDLDVEGDELRLSPPGEPRGRRLPIDHFFRSLAQAHRARSIGVVLSGTGSDGTDGLRAIRAVGGLTLAQVPETAMFDAMPRSAIEAGVVDLVAPIDELAGVLVAGQIDDASRGADAGTGPMVGSGSDVGPSTTVDDVMRIVELLESRTGRDLSLHKRSSIARRIDRRMLSHQLASIADYLRLVTRMPEELDVLADDLLIGVTSFFRDPEVWTALRDDVLPGLLAEAVQAGGVVRVWTPACSTGEEAYTVAMTFREAMDRISPRPRVRLRIFATDVDPVAIEHARSGRYPRAIEADVSPERLARFFVESDGGYRIAPDIRELVVFAQQDLTTDPPFTRIDLITCRNLLIYFEPELQRRILPLFHHALQPGGVLVLGTAESCSAAPDLFEPVVGRARIMRRRHVPTSPRAFELPFPAVNRASVAPRPVVRGTDPSTLQAVVEELLRRTFAPSAVLATATGDVVFVNGRTGRYLEPPVGKASLDLIAMTRESLRAAVAQAFRTARRQRSSCSLRAVNTDADPPTVVEITATPVTEPPEASSMVLVVFSEIGAIDDSGGTVDGEGADRDGGPPTAGASALADELAAAQAELRAASEEVQIAKQEMSSMNEELQSANEELQSANEELQAANEELMRSKEEMQSMNEELRTINLELQARVDELVQQSDDMRNLLDSTDIATLFLDSGLGVRRFTPKVTEMFNLIPSDIGRAITDLTTRLVYPELSADVSSVLRDFTPVQREVTDEAGRWFSVRVMPYRTQDRRIDGTVLTFTDITDAKQRELHTASDGLDQRPVGGPAESGDDA